MKVIKHEMGHTVIKIPTVRPLWAIQLQKAGTNITLNMQAQ